MRPLIIAVLAAIVVASMRSPSQSAPDAIANDNRTPAGVRSGDTLVLRLVATKVTWRINGDNDPGFATLAFAEEGKPPMIPAPLIRVRAGTPIVATVTNPLADTLMIEGLGPRGDGVTDSLRILPGTSETVRFAAGQPGSYLYRGVTSQQLPGNPNASFRVRQMNQIASTLAGAFIVDSGRVMADRVMVITTLLSSRTPNRDRHGVPTIEFNAINGKAWPHSERLTYALRDSVRWRILNASTIPHPMHLHGFYFRVDSRGSSRSTDVDTTLVPASRTMAVTEVIPPSGSRSIVWSPDRAGGWIFHCHLTNHAVGMPPVETRDGVPFATHSRGDPDTHTLTGMSGLVTAITVTGPTLPSTAWRPTNRLKLLVQSDSAPSDPERRFGYVLVRDKEPRSDSVEYPGPVLVLTRGEATTIEVVNRTTEATAVHWHGIEIESYYDGAAGWSGTPGANGRTAPAIHPGRSFEVRLTPKRAGTFMYHTHIDELRQQFGLVGGLIVLEPGERWDPTHDLLFMISDGVPQRAYVNGSLDPAMIALKVGEKYRIRLADIAVYHPGFGLQLARGDSLVEWRLVAKDGFSLPASRVRSEPALGQIASGETVDFEFVPDQPGELELSMRATTNGPRLMSLRFRVSAK